MRQEAQEFKVGAGEGTQRLKKFKAILEVAVSLGYSGLSQKNKMKQQNQPFLEWL